VVTTLELRRGPRATPSNRRRRRSDRGHAVDQISIGERLQLIDGDSPVVNQANAALAWGDHIAIDVDNAGVGAAASAS
jgi:hypothetical protein